MKMITEEELNERQNLFFSSYTPEEYLKIHRTHCCRNCKAKSLLYIVRGENDIYLLCGDCIDELMDDDGEIMEREIATYNWDYERIQNRSAKFDEKWHKKTFGCG